MAEKGYFFGRNPYPVSIRLPHVWAENRVPVFRALRLLRVARGPKSGYFTLKWANLPLKEGQNPLEAGPGGVPHPLETGPGGPFKGKFFKYG